MTGQGSAQIAGGVMGGLAKAAPLTLAEAVPRAPGATMIAATAVPLTKILEVAIER